MREYKRIDLWGIPLFSYSFSYGYRCTACNAASLGPRPAGAPSPPVTHRFGLLLFFVAPALLFFVINFAVDKVATHRREARRQANLEKMRPFEERREKLLARDNAIRLDIRELNRRCNAFVLGTRASKALPNQTPADRSLLRAAPVLNQGSWFVPVGPYFGPKLLCEERYREPPIVSFPWVDGNPVSDDLDRVEKSLDEIRSNIVPLPDVVVLISQDSSESGKPKKVYAIATWIRTSDSAVLARAQAETWGDSDPVMKKIDLEAGVRKQIERW